jgi:hypothetical protein
VEGFDNHEISSSEAADYIQRRPVIISIHGGRKARRHRVRKTWFYHHDLGIAASANVRGSNGFVRHSSS